MISTIGSPKVLIVISHYNAWSPDHLIDLLDQMQQTPAGYPYRVRVVVNQANQNRLILPHRHAEVEVLHRENTGFNIGAWEIGWRAMPTFDYYLFLQEECRVLRHKWLWPFVKRLKSADIGLIGESLYSEHPITWAQEQSLFSRNHPNESNFFEFAHSWMIEKCIDPGFHVNHLQSLVLASRREVLEVINGFQVGRDKMEAIAAEIAISRSVIALGLRVEQIGFYPFSYILHPQWQGKADGARTKSATLGKVLRIAIPRHFRG